MSRLSLKTESRAEMVVETLYKDMERRIMASPTGICPVELTGAFLKMAQAQTCGKCTPCRIGLVQLSNLMDDVWNNPSLEVLDKIESLAQSIAKSADCAIGVESARMVLKALDGFHEDFVSHIVDHHCICEMRQSIPCVSNCPAGVDIPGYVALVGEKRYADAVRLIRKDNPFPAACALVCEHPCETRCRRTLLDDPINIRCLKRVAVENAGVVPAPSKAESTGKRVAIIGGGPSGLSAAYYLQLMGHQCTVFEQHKKLGGMLVYGIPAYRLPRHTLQTDIDNILSTGVEVRLNTCIGTPGNPSMDELRKQYDAVYISIGAHSDKKAGVEGEDSKGVLSAVDFLGAAGDDEFMDLRGKKVCIIGGGNVAMDCTRTAIRCGADKVTVAYRRRVADMTALPEEIEGAIAEGAVMKDLYKPKRIEVDENGQVTALWVEPNMVNAIKNGRMTPVPSNKEDQRIPCDLIVVAVGQGIGGHFLDEVNIPLVRGVIKAENWTAIEDAPGVFAGGDCVTGPKTAVRAIAAGKVAAANIDNYLGYRHVITTDVNIPAPSIADRPYCGRIDAFEREAGERRNDFEPMEVLLTEKEACQEAGRCLRCDHFGCGVFRGGRKTEW